VVIKLTYFKKQLLQLEISEDDRWHFIYDCRDWGEYCEALQLYDKLKVLRLIKYFITERRSAKRMLARAIMRFNALNKLTERDLR